MWFVGILLCDAIFSTMLLNLKNNKKKEKKEKKKTKRIVQAYIYIFGRVHRYTRAIETIYYIETT